MSIESNRYEMESLTLKPSINKPIIVQQVNPTYTCPECDGSIVFASGCRFCPSCGWEACG